MFPVTRWIVRTSVLSSILAGSMLASIDAKANRLFPGLLKDNVPMPCAPLCTLCHKTTGGGPGNLRSDGIVTTWTQQEIVMSSDVLDGNNANSLVPVLKAIEKLQPPLDTDKDGVPDLQELMMGDDPDTPGQASLCANITAGPTFGCARVAPEGQIDNVAGLASGLVALMGIAALRRRAHRA
jgi:hypothetical protein